MGYQCDIIDPARTVMIVVDMQNDFVAEGAKLRSCCGDEPCGNAVIRRRGGGTVPADAATSGHRNRAAGCVSRTAIGFRYRVIGHFVLE